MLKFIKSYLLKKKLRRSFSTLEIRGNIYVEYPENLSFGNYCFINEGCYWSAKGGIEIGSNVIFGPNTTVWTYNHNYEGDYIPYGGEDILKKVTIEDNVWVGMNTIIMPGVTIKEGAIVAAGSVVVKDVESLSIVGGNPARELKKRNQEKYNFKKKNNFFYQEMIFKKRYINK